MAKGNNPPNPNPIPPVDNNPGLIHVYCNVSGDPRGDTPYVISDSGVKYFGSFLGTNRIEFQFPAVTPPAGWGGSLFWTGHNSRVIIPEFAGSYEGGLLNPAWPTISYQAVIPSFTREQICNPKITFSGLMINTTQFGNQPWFEIAWQCLSSKADRDSVLAQKKANGDTAQIIEFFNTQSKIYDEPGVWLNQCVTQVGEFNQSLFKSFITEILTAGLVPVVVYDGDNADNPVNGYPNALRQLPILNSLLNEYNDKILYARFWDGVFYGSTPENIKNFGRQFRILNPNGHLAIEFNPGHIPVGNGAADYRPGGMMVDYDVIAGEFLWPSANRQPPAIAGATYDTNHGYVPVWASDASNWLTVWQVNARLLPSYKAPSNQPFNVLTVAIDGPNKGHQVVVSSDSSNPVNYLASGNSRGRYYFWALELGEYEWTRNRVTVNELKAAGQYYKNLGCYNIGFPS